MKKERRWIKSAIAASAEQVIMPWARTARRKPAAMRSVEAQKISAAAGR